MADKVKIGTMWFGGCSGCHLSIADFHESLIDVMEFADFEFSPVLMDTKYDEVPDLDIIIVEGGIRNDENRELAEMLNEKGISYREVIRLEDVLPQLDLLYMTRVQRERFFNEEDYIRISCNTSVIPHFGSAELQCSRQDIPVRGLLRSSGIMSQLSRQVIGTHRHTERCGH